MWGSAAGRSGRGNGHLPHRMGMTSFALEVKSWEASIVGCVEGKGTR